MQIDRDLRDIYWLSAIVNSSDDAIISNDLDGIIASWNPAAERIFGYPESEAVGQHITFFIPEHLHHEERNINARVQDGERIERFETTRLHKDGTCILVSLTISPIRNHEGEVIGASKIVRDIREQRKIEEKQAMLAAIVDSSDDIIISKNLDSIITSWNHAAERLLGYSEKEAIGRHIALIIPPALIDEEVMIIDKIKKGERIEHFETMRRRKDGSYIQLSITVSPIKDKTGKIIGASKIARDITDKIHIEHKLKQQTQKLKALNQAKDEFIGMASHELKTPLTSITAYLQLLERNLKSEVEKVYVQKTLSFVNKLTRLISELLDVSKIQAGKLQLNFTTFNFEHLIDECVESVQHTSKSHKIIREGAPVNVPVIADRQRIEQVLVNYLTNAIKYSPKADKVIVSATVDEKNVTVAVQDFGIGIPAEEQKKIFSRFYRVEGLNPGIPGLGIGLFISAEIIMRHNGKVWVESEDGKGSIFYFSLPLRQENNN